MASGVAQDIESLGSASASDQQHRDLLQQMINEGLNPSSEITPADEDRYRRLLQVLFESCILKPSRKPPTTMIVDRAKLSLAVMFKLAGPKPSIFSRLPVGQDKSVPLFKWIIPRLIDAAARWVEEEEGRELADQIVGDIVKVLGLMRRDEVTQVGDGQVGVLLRQLQHFCSDVYEKKAASLFGYTIEPNPAVMLVTLKIIVRARYPLSDYANAMAGLLLADYIRPILQRRELHGEVINLLILAADSPIQASVLAPAWATLLSQPDIDLRPFFVGIKTNLSLRYDVWRALHSQAEILSLPLHATKIIQLLTPIEEDMLSFDNIRDSLPDLLIKQWRQDLVETPDHDRAIIEALLNHKQPHSPESRKRKREEVGEDQTRLLLKEALPDLQLAEDGQPLRDLCKAVSGLTHEDLVKLASVMPKIVETQTGDSIDDILLWTKLATKISGNGSLWKAFKVIYQRHNAAGTGRQYAMKVWNVLSAKLAARDRRERIFAGRAVCQVIGSPNGIWSTAMNGDSVLKRLSQLSTASVTLQETSLSTIGALGRSFKDDDLCTALELLLQRLSPSTSTPIRNVAVTELHDIARHHGKTPYALMYPFLDRISVAIVRNIKSRPDIVTDALTLLGQARQSFIQTTLNYTIPALVVEGDREALMSIAAVVDIPLSELLVEKATEILTHILLQRQPRMNQKAVPPITFLVNTIRNTIDPNQVNSITPATLVNSCHMPLAVNLIIELGDEDKRVDEMAQRALREAQRIKDPKHPDDLGAFLKPVMLGILTHLNDTLHDMRGKKTVPEKKKLIRSLGALIKLVGDSMSSYSPQIMQSLQSTLVLKELRHETLNTWGIFVRTMKFADFGPFVGRTTGALVANWSHFTPPERQIAVKIINEIVGNAQQLKPYLDEIVGLDGIPELGQIGAALMESRRKLKPEDQLQKILDRASSQNTAIATTSMRELKGFLVNHQNGVIAQYSMGDTFDPMVPAIMKTLLAASTRDGECDELKMLAYECIGIIGALDPDRFTLPSDPPPFTITSNFTDHNESKAFALHLVRDVLVDAFRATNDTKLQSYLAYAMQELLKFCDFGPELLGSIDGHRSSKKGEKSVPLATRREWDSLPKDQLEILAPLLESRFSLAEIPMPQTAHPIYPTASSYRDWLHQWTADLIGRVMAQPQTKANVDCQIIFGAFRGVLKHQDVAVSHRLLPHLVLHVLIMGDPAASHEIRQEINVVLQDQVNGLSTGPEAGRNPTGAENKRTFSSQLIFDLMDHISRWMQVRYNRQHYCLTRAKGLRMTNEQPEKEQLLREASEIKLQTPKVSDVIDSIEVEMVAKAALQSRALARSLRNFEQRMIDLRHGEEKFGNDRLQVYFERLHEIYAALDEPDGMEGVSTYVIAPSLEHQIREHESTGRWTSAQSCWEVRLQQNQDEVGFHIGLLKCLQNLGHYGEQLAKTGRGELTRDTLQTHIRGVLSVRPDWTNDLAEFQAEAAWITGDWTKLEQLGDLGGPIGPVLSGLQRGQPVAPLLETARWRIGQGIISRDYTRSYDVALKLHQLREIELVWDAKNSRVNPALAGHDNNAATVARKTRNDFVQMLQQRFDTTSPGFRVREAILTIRRTALSLIDVPDLRDEIGRAWIQSSRIARKAGYAQTAYTAALQAKQVDAAFAFVQQVKLVKGSDGVFKALTSLENSVKPIKDEIERQNNRDKKSDAVQTVEEKEESFARDRQLAKALLLEARWAKETDRFSVNDVVHKFKEASAWDTVLESPYYHLGHYYDTLDHASADGEAQANYQTVQHYIMALKFGVKYIYQTMPRMLTLWLDLGEKEAMKKTNASAVLAKITKLINNSRNELPAYQFLTAFPQIVSRIGHPKMEIHHLLRKIMALVIQNYPRQALWPTVGVMQSNRAERKAACTEVLQRAQLINGSIQPWVRDAERLSSALLKLANDATGNDKREMSVAASYNYVRQALPSRMIMPLQDALTPTLPISAGMVHSHNPFPYEPVTIEGVVDKIEIMPSLQRPKKIVFLGSDRQKYPMLCKPHDDLRKDARLMDFNSMINKLLQSASESRRRQLYIRTYAVMPLNEECGLLEWVINTNAFKRILDKEYAKFGKKLYESNDLHTMLETSRKHSPRKQIEVFEQKIIPMYSPSVFQIWFVQTWPEPRAWLAARMAYSRTLAVMSMIGHVLGLGDRHGENILFDSTTGDTVHVDLNCLFEKGKTFEIPEKVPFRLTHNMVDALGVTGVEGVFRKAAEIAMGILRSNSDSLMSVLEAFAHDPLVEWASRSGRAKSEKDIRSSAERNLAPIRAKLRGANTGDPTINSVPGQVDKLIKEATSSENLAVMYQGWAPYL